MVEAYKPTLTQSLAVQWFTERGKCGYCDSIEALEECLNDLALASTSEIVNRTFDSVNFMIQMIYEAAVIEQQTMGAIV